MSEPFIGEIYLVPYNFAPRGYAFCAGQLLPIAQNTALFSLLGTTFGGNGVTTFALPDLRGRVAVGVGAGPGLPAVALGESAGQQAVTLTPDNMPAHNHPAAGTQAAANAARPANRFPAAAAGATYRDTSDGTLLNGAFIQNAGGGQPFDNRQPYLGINYIIALEGIFPSRN